MSRLPPPLHFVTSNPHKAIEVAHLFGSSVRRVDLDLPEIQASSLDAIVCAKLDAAKELSPHPVAVEDVSLELVALGGFPGPYVRWLIGSAGGEGLAEMARGLRTREAVARCLVGLWDGQSTHLTEGTVSGEVLVEPRGSRGFGWDAWFLPERSERTFGEMSTEEKAEVSHRGKAWKEMRQLRAPGK